MKINIQLSLFTFLLFGLSHFSNCFFVPDDICDDLPGEGFGISFSLKNRFSDFMQTSSSVAGEKIGTAVSDVIKKNTGDLAGLGATVANLTGDIVKEKAESLGETLTKRLEEAAHKVTEDSGEIIGKKLEVIGATLNRQLENTANRVGVNTAAILNKAADDVKVKIDGTVNDALNKANQTFNQTYKKNLLLTACVITGLVTIGYGSKLLWGLLEKQLSKPKLLASTSKISLFDRIKSKIFGSKPVEKKPLVFSSDTTVQLNRIIGATRVINQRIRQGDNSVKYRNLLLWGPPGTGKTLFATTLAHECGMEFAIMSGSSFSDLIEKGEAIEVLSDLFKWANNSKKGLMIFIDEAESLLSQRGQADPTGKRSIILNQFLNYTGAASDKFMLVFATNYPEILDQAIGDRIVDSVKLDLPKLNERFKILIQYRDTIFRDVSVQLKESVFNQYLSDENLKNLAQQTEGLSGRVLANLMNVIASNAAITDSGLVDQEVIELSLKDILAKESGFKEQFKNPKAA